MKILALLNNDKMDSISLLKTNSKTSFQFRKFDEVKFCIIFRSVL